MQTTGFSQFTPPTTRQADLGGGREALHMGQYKDFRSFSEAQTHGTLYILPWGRSPETEATESQRRNTPSQKIKGIFKLRAEIKDIWAVQKA